jgi:tRNA threonylcarbamoyladenosine biosynthesis protein TsaB
MAPCLTTPEALSAAWAAGGDVAPGPAALPPAPASAPAWIAGSAPGVFGTRLRVPAGARVLDTAAGRAAALLRLACAAADAGAGVDPAQALPLYLRDKVAFTTAERAAARLVSAA